MNAHTRWIVAGLTLSLALLGAGCTATDEEVESTTPALQDVALDAPTAPPPEPIEVAHSEAPLLPSSAGCLHGTWLADNQFMRTMISGYGGEALNEVTGAVLLTYDPNGALTTEYREWRLVSSDQGEQITIRRDEIDLGEYTLGNGTISFADLELGSMLTVSAADFEMNQIPEPTHLRDIPYTCEGDLATMEIPEGRFTMERQR